MKNRAKIKIVAVAGKLAIDLEILMSYHLTEMCLPIFNIYCQMRKGVKYFLLNCLKLHENTLSGVSYVFVNDMGVIWTLITRSTADREKRRYHIG